MTRTPLRWVTATAATLALAVTGLGSATVAQAAELPVVDDFETPLSSGSDGTVPVGWYQATDPDSSMSYQLSDTPPAPVPDAAADNTVLQTDFDITAWGVVVHAFSDEATSTWTTQDWSAYEGLQFWLHGTGSGTDLFVDVIDNRPDGSTSDNAERFTAAFSDDTAGWRLVQLPFLDMTRKEIGNGAPNDDFQLTEVHGWAFGTLATDGLESYYIDDVSLYGVAPERPLTVSFGTVDTPVEEGDSVEVPLKLSKPADEDVTVRVQSTTGIAVAGEDYEVVDTVVTIPAGATTGSVTVETIDDLKYTGERGFILELSSPTVAEMGRPPLTRVLVTDNETLDPNLVEDFEQGPDTWWSDSKTTLDHVTATADGSLARPGQAGPETILKATSSKSQARFGSDFVIQQDWSGADAVSFWYYGQGGTSKGKAKGNAAPTEVTVTLDSAAASAGDGDPSTWELAWSDEFNEPAGTPPNPENWTHEIGDGTIIGKPGWGNDELQYYTDSTDNVATDGEGNLVITTREVTDDDGPMCYYGPCRYTSARLVTEHKAEFAYGRIESRVQVSVGDGLWPAFWSLGTDILENPWPQSGEIDIMENVGRDPDILFGTIHGPGYSGGQSYGATVDFGEPMGTQFHTVNVDWSPDRIVWNVDGQQYHEAVPADVAPNEWVFNHPFFLLLNQAVGGNFGGAVGEDTEFPAEYAIDYVRVYQGDLAETSHTATFADDFAGWQLVTIPLSEFDGLDATAVSGISFDAKVHPNRPVYVDQIRTTCGTEATVTTAADSGPGSVRAALKSVCADGTVTVDPSLAGETVTLGSPLSLTRNVTVDASAAGGFTLDGAGTVRHLEVAADTEATLTGMTLVNGYGFELAGSILNNGSLTLEHMVITDNRVSTSGIDFWKGGGGIYTGENASLRLVDSTVADNTVEGGPAGGLYGFFGSTTTIERSTISGNTASDVGGGVRSLGDATIVNSTISGNTATGWHGGGIFATDGTVTIESSTITANTSPEGTSGGIFLGTFGDSAANMAYANTIIAGNGGAQCFIAYFGSGPVSLASGGHSLVGDGSCGSTGDTDLVGADPALGPLADNGGPTLTHDLDAGSPAVDAAGTGPQVDQRGQARPAGAASDIGSVESR